MVLRHAILVGLLSAVVDIIVLAESMIIWHIRLLFDRGHTNLDATILFLCELRCRIHWP